MRMHKNVLQIVFKRCKFRWNVLFCAIWMVWQEIHSNQLVRMTKIVYAIFCLVPIICLYVDSILNVDEIANRRKQGAWIIFFFDKCSFQFNILYSLWNVWFLWIVLFLCGRTYFHKVTFKINGKISSDTTRVYNCKTYKKGFCYLLKIALSDKICILERLL